MDEWFLGGAISLLASLATIVQFLMSLREKTRRAVEKGSTDPDTTPERVKAEDRAGGFWRSTVSIAVWRIWAIAALLLVGLACTVIGFYLLSTTQDPVVALSPYVELLAQETRLGAGGRIALNLGFTNEGSGTAYDTVWDVGVLVAPDVASSDARSELYLDWRDTARQPPPIDVPPTGKPWRTESWGPLRPADVVDLVNGRKVIYAFGYASYSDRNGENEQQFCLILQAPIDPPQGGAIDWPNVWQICGPQHNRVVRE